MQFKSLQFLKTFLIFTKYFAARCKLGTKSRTSIDHRSKTEKVSRFLMLAELIDHFLQSMLWKLSILYQLSMLN